MLKGKNTIITGARRGLGRAVVEVFAKNGSNIWACARKEDLTFEQDMKKLSDYYGVSIWPIYFDMTSEEQIKRAVQKIRKSKCSVDALINVAGVAEESTSFSMTSMDKMRFVFEVNFFGITILTQYVSRIMMNQKKGSIIQISSVAGLDGTPAQYEYAASKAAVIGSVKQLSREMGLYHVRVNAVAPGIINTDMGEQIQDELLQKTISRVTMGRMAVPEEVANVIAFLASDLSSYITGQVIRVDGGM